ncbi:ROK family protein [Streptomyces calidiresistens]|uniref:ROK family protein n=1 Tax=Streptomyces calidiresistens TaxID=1485586 RepID=A0A7W3T4M5_9ACTN|nr:ROK family protein [Streptomyces calidiresistens]MBB0230853.1 ROK family protein [Streptomyces calidiresistens]
MNQASSGHLLGLIRRGRATTRGELQRVTGLARSTVGSRLEPLLRAGWIRETPGPAESSTGGRPAVRLEFDASHALVLAAVLETRNARVALLDLAGRVIDEQAGPLSIADGPDRALDLLGERFTRLLERNLHRDGVTASRICAAGLSVPGPVDALTRRLVEPPIMPGWGGHPLPERLRAVLAGRLGTDPGLPVLVENDANLMALAEQRHGHPDCAAFLLVKVSTGIGAGMVVDGGLYRGIDGGAGDIGHIRTAEASDAPCMCGSRGCLAAVASGRALAARLTAEGVPTASGSGVRELLAAGHPDAVRLAREAGRVVGDVLATVVTVVNPGVLMLAGDLAGPPFLTGVRELLYRRAMPRTTAHLEVVTSRLGDRAGLIGAAVLLADELYAPGRADERLAVAARARAVGGAASVA